MSKNLCVRSSIVCSVTILETYFVLKLNVNYIIPLS